ncbi:hypothetical protein [Corynebacterium liangguodongii]|uniref:hypothetical protein n=1 Tax=Corynebacterium liangguodongii TaxID=2079535 RepID=UPI001F1A83F8|nr:hypothetical protein [Corynebacterium liangguodongii]
MRTRGEVVGAYVWLSAGAAASALLEVASLDSLPAAPIAVTAAALFNSVLTRTAALWPVPRAALFIPLAVWLASAVAMCFGNNIRAVSAATLLVAGMAGGVWPAQRRR